jgi:MerR family transcriptional regulator, light-induced transcriptional regulator
VEEQLTTRQVADALKVSESSVKRWCDQGAIPTIRTVGGHRRIPAEGFRHFLEKNSQQSKTAFDGVVDGNRDTTTGSASDVDWLAELELAIIEGNEAACRDVMLNCYARCKNFSRLADEVIAPTFRRLGELWSCGDIEIYQERRGCEICQRVLHELLKTLSPPTTYAPVAVGGTPSGDNYSLSNQLTELVLRECDWQTVNLGCNLPLQTIAQAAQKFDAQLVWLSVSHLEDEESFVGEFVEFRKKLPASAHIVLGGRALHDKLRPQLHYTGHCDNLQQLTAFAHALRATSRKPL